MNGIDRRGMKVVCVQAFDWESDIGSLIPGPDDGTIYTVLDFLDNKGLPIQPDELWGDEDYNAAIDLIELRAPMLTCGRRIGWPIACFKPVDDRATDISIFTGITTRELEPV